jgi:hypothetical protein
MDLVNAVQLIGIPLDQHIIGSGVGSHPRQNGYARLLSGFIDGSFGKKNRYGFVVIADSIYCLGLNSSFGGTAVL